MATTRETLKTNLQSIAKTAPIEEMVQAAQQFKNKAEHWFRITPTISDSDQKVEFRNGQ